MQDFADLDASGDAQPAPLSHRQVLVVMSGLMLGLLLAGLDHTIVATALPTIVGELGGLADISWVVTAYLLATTVSTPLYGKLGDLFGRKRLFQVAIVIFLAGSAACGVAQSMGQLIAFRAVQGLGGGGLIVLAQAVIADIVSPRDRGRYQGYFTATFGASSVLGPLAGGFFTDHLTWRWAFYVNLPLGVLALVVTAAVLPTDGRREARPRLDATGAVLLSVAITGLVLVTTWGGSRYAWGSSVILGLSAATLAAFGLLVAVERRAAEPVLPPRLFGGSVFRVAAAMSFITGAAMFSAISFMPLFLQVVSGASATESGLLLVPMMAGLIGSSTWAGRRITATGSYRRFPIAGTAIGACGLGFLASMGPQTDRFTSGTYLLVFGIGIGLVMPVLVLATQNAVARTDLGVATSTVAFFRMVGGSIGVATLGAIFNARLARSGIETAEGISPDAVRLLPPEAHTAFVDSFSAALTGGFRLAVPVLAAAFVLSWALRELPLRTTLYPHVE